MTANIYPPLARWTDVITVRPIYIADSARVLDFVVPEGRQDDNL